MLFVQFPRQDVSTFYNRANICQNSSFINHHRAALRNPLYAIPFPFLGPIPLPRNSFLGVTTIFSIGAIAVVNFLPKKKGNPNNLILPYYYFHLIVPKIFQSEPSTSPPRGKEKEKKRKNIVSSFIVLPLSSPSKKRSVERSTVAKIGFQPARRRYLFVADRSLVFSGARLPTDRAGLSRGIFPPLDHPGGPRGRR